jgi:CHAD domain-containing protein
MTEPVYVKLKDIKPALSGYIREAQELLKISGATDEKVVHDVRVLMKKSRAALKLLASQIDKDSYERDTKSFREVGRLMSGWRDTSVQRKILKDLRKKYPGLFVALQEKEKIEAILKKTPPAEDASEKMKNEVVQIEDILNKTGYRIRFQTMNNIDPQILIKELERSYLKVISIYLACRNKPEGNKLHEFRKKSKDFLYQLYYFRPLNQPVVKSLEKKLDGLTRNLGKFNDLTQLINALGYNYHDETNSPALNELIIRMREMQDLYLKKVWPAAFKIFCPGQKLLNLLGFKILIF